MRNQFSKGSWHESKQVEHSEAEIAAMIEAHMGGVSVTVHRDSELGWNASIQGSQLIKAAYGDRLKEIVSVMHEHGLILRLVPD